MLQPPDAQCTRMHSGLLHLNPDHWALRLLCRLVSCAFPVPPPQSQPFSGPPSAPGAVISTLPAFSHLTFLRVAHPATLLCAQRSVVQRVGSLAQAGAGQLRSWASDRLQYLRSKYYAVLLLVVKSQNC